MELVSIIIPAYNLRNNIEYSVRSALSQTYPNIEVVIVDDGSTDGTSEICDRLAEENNNVTVIHTNNGGVSRARNIGMENSHGEYIMFLDGDDIISHNIVEILLNDCMSNDKCIYAGASYEKIFSYDYSFNEVQNGTLHAIEKDALLVGLMSGGYENIGVLGKVFKRSIIDNLNFMEGKADNEDKFFLFELAIKNVGIIFERDDKLFGYFQRSDSVCHRGYRDEMISSAEFSDMIIDIIRKEKPYILRNAEFNDLVTRLAILKSIIRSRLLVEKKATYNMIKNELISRYDNKNKSFYGRYYIEYQVMKYSSILYCLCVRIYDTLKNNN